MSFLRIFYFIPPNFWGSSVFLLKFVKSIIIKFNNYQFLGLKSVIFLIKSIFRKRFRNY